MEEIRKIPPVTRTLLAGTAAVTLPCLLALTTPYKYALIWPMVKQKWHFYRILTSFFYGGQGLPFLFDVFFLYRNSNDLELNHFARRTADYVFALIIAGLGVIAANYPLQTPILFSPMLNALTYIWSRANSHTKVSFFGVISCPAPWLPYAYLMIDLVRGGPGLAIQSATGLLSGFIYWYLKETLPRSGGPRLAETPRWLSNALPDSQDPATVGDDLEGGRRGRNLGFGTAWNAGQRLGNTTVGSNGPGMFARLRRMIPTLDRGRAGETVGGGSRRATGGGPDREAMLAAAEKRLRSQGATSIIGRHKAAESSVNTSPVKPNASSAVRRTAAAAPGIITFGQYANRASGQEGEEDHSSSGGSVAEQRRNPPSPQEKGKSKEASWGPGQRLGE